MTVTDVFELRREGRIEEAYDAIRAIYATDKGYYASLAMFWTAVDILKKRVAEDRIEEAVRIYRALERLVNGLEDKNTEMLQAMKRCQDLLDRGRRREKLSDEGPHHLQIGIWGEEMAIVYLREKGYVILERDWHSGHRDIDIIAQHGDCLVFVGVKTRSSHGLTDPEFAVNHQKLKNLRLAMNHYIKYRKVNMRCRFDVITVVGTMDGPMPEITHIEDFTII